MLLTMIINSRVLHTCIVNKSFVQLIDISAKTFIFLKTLKSESPYINWWFPGQNSQPLEVEDKIKITLVIN